MLSGPELTISQDKYYLPGVGSSPIRGFHRDHRVAKLISILGVAGQSQALALSQIITANTAITYRGHFTGDGPVGVADAVEVRGAGVAGALDALQPGHLAGPAQPHQESQEVGQHGALSSLSSLSQSGSQFYCFSSRKL